MSAVTEHGTDDYLPARMLNEFVYCPRLFYYEHVEGLFVHNRETVEGSLRHQKLDAGTGALKPADELPENERLQARSVTLSSHRHRLIAKLDIVECEDGRVSPVDYKRGSPRRNADGAPEAWDADRVQLAAQAMVLRENGYACDEAVAYYVATRQRVAVPVNEELLGWAETMLSEARTLAAGGRMPPPLVDSPKCPRCSLVGICLPDETRSLSGDRGLPGVQLTLFPVDDPPQSDIADAVRSREPVRRLVPARDDLRPLYLNTQGLCVGKSGSVLHVHEKDKLVQEVRIGEICQLNLFGNVQLTTQAVQTLCEQEVPIAYFSFGGWFYGLTQGLGLQNAFLRSEQYRAAATASFCLRFARSIVAGKIRNQRTMLQRNHTAPPARALDLLKVCQEDAQRAESLDQLLGIEGFAARTYFENFSGLVKQADEAAGLPGATVEFTFHFRHRNRRPPRDPVNALLSLAYSVLAKDLTIVCHAIGFDPYWGFYHQPRHGRAPLALDLMEPFRPLIADSAVLSAINTRMVTERDFVRAGESVSLKPEGRKAFFRAYEQRMDTLVTHPLFGYRVSYRRMLEIQARLLARVLTGEIDLYPVFTTR